MNKKACRLKSTRCVRGTRRKNLHKNVKFLFSSRLQARGETSAEGVDPALAPRGRCQLAFLKVLVLYGQSNI